MRAYLLVIIAVGLALVGYECMSARDTRFLSKRNSVVEIVRSTFQQPYGGLTRLPSGGVPQNLEFPGAEMILTYAHTRSGWYGDDQWEAVYHPQPDGQTAPPVQPDKVLNFYFSKLEAAGFKSAVQGVPLTETGTMLLATKSWADDDRTLLVTAHVVSDKHSGETIVTTTLRESLTW